VQCLAKHRNCGEQEEGTSYIRIEGEKQHVIMTSASSLCFSFSCAFIPCGQQILPTKCSGIGERITAKKERRNIKSKKKIIFCRKSAVEAHYVLGQ
jgi:hypothetical protein